MDIDITNNVNPRNIQDREIDISFKDATGKEFKFNTLYKLQDFIASETEFWIKAEEPLQINERVSLEERTQVHNFRTEKTPLVYLIMSTGRCFQDLNHRFEIEIHGSLFDTQPDQDNKIKTAINSVQHKLDRAEFNYWIWSEHVLCRKGLNIFNESGAIAASSFFEAFIEKPTFTNLNSLEGFKGALIAYEFQMQGENGLENRTTLEAKSVKDLKDNILEIRDNLYTDVNKSKEEFDNWKKGTAESYKTDTKNLHESHNKKFNQWLVKVENLENTYKEKLRLEPAASYWNTKAEDYKKLGNRWAFILSGFVAVGLAIFGVLFYTWVNAQATAISIDSLQGVVLFITLLSVYAFAIKALSKLVFSSYHLQRDAEEREQLTYLYLSLTHEKDDFDTDARSIVLQALFSRADTGLISGDSSPTMPGVHEIINASSNR